MRFIVGIAGLVCIGLFLLGDDKGIDEPIANVPKDIPMPIPIDQIRSKYLADDKQFNGVTKLEPVAITTTSSWSVRQGTSRWS